MTDVPPTPYLTLLDRYVLAAFVLIGIIVIENFVVSLCAPSSHTTRRVDQIFTFSLALVWVLFHLFVVVGTKLHLFYPTWEQVYGNDEASMERVEKGPEAVKRSFDDDDDDDDDDGRRGSRFSTRNPSITAGAGRGPMK